jgi:hypothetical protein
MHIKPLPSLACDMPIGSRCHISGIDPKNNTGVASFMVKTRLRADIIFRIPTHGFCSTLIAKEPLTNSEVPCVIDGVLAN